MEPATPENYQFQIKLKPYKELLKRQYKKAKRYLEKASNQLEACQGGENEFHLATLLQSNLYKKPTDNKIILEDWETGEKITLALDPKLKPFEEVAKRFKKARKLKAGLPFAEKELGKAEANLFTWNLAKENFGAITTEEDLACFLQEYPLKEPQKIAKTKPLVAKKPYIEKVLENGDKIWIGKSAAANDELTFQHAHGNDFWLHIAEGPGSHVVIHRPKEPLDPTTLQAALQEALLHSKARNCGSGEIVMTRVKSVKRIGKKKGLVQIAGEKKHRVTIRDKR